MGENPYERSGWRGRLRPGGDALTGHLLEESGLPAGARILDVGCGMGDSCALLRDRGYEALGLDRSAPLIARGLARRPDLPLAVGDGARPPFPPGSMDALLMECALSAMDAPAVLAGCVPLLRPGGRLLLADLYARGTEDLRRAPALRTRPGLEALLAASGLRRLAVEDHTRARGEVAGPLLLDGGDLSALLCRPMSEFRAARAGYCLLWARREGEAL